MPKILVSWIGSADYRAAAGEEGVGLGPVGLAASKRFFDHIHLINNFPNQDPAAFAGWLKGFTESSISVHTKKLSSPTDFGEIHQSVVAVLKQLLNKHGENTELTFHLSPGTPSMAAVWIILAKTQFPAELIEASREQGVKTSSVPFDLAAEFNPELLRAPDKRLEKQLASLPPDAPEFDDIIHQSHVMKRVIHRARKAAIRSVPILIEGESGTGKELLARAIHKASLRKNKSFIPVNCGAIPAELVESELFGHSKGSFTGANKSKAGLFEAADGGSLFLDEIGELPAAAQVKLLRTLQEGEITKIGTTVAKSVDVRIIAATNRNLVEEVAQGNFRSDLFYRLAVAVIQLPSITDRPGDLSLLIDRLIEQVNKEGTKDPAYRHKKISISAKNLLLQHPWPGNVRELMNTLTRAAIWADGDVIRSEDMREALIPVGFSNESSILNRPIADGFDLHKVIGVVAHHYLSRALDDTGGRKANASKILGFSNYQTFTNWLKKYNVTT